MQVGGGCGPGSRIEGRPARVEVSISPGVPECKQFEKLLAPGDSWAPQPRPVKQAHVQTHRLGPP